MIQLHVERWYIMNIPERGGKRLSYLKISYGKWVFARKILRRDRKKCWKTIVPSNSFGLLPL